MIVYLTKDTFTVHPIGARQELRNKIPGFSLVLFSSDNCQYCRDFYPYFKKMADLIQGCVFGLVNVDRDNQGLVRISHRTSTPLEYVPYIMFYYNGCPIAQYMPDEGNPASNLEKLRRFLLYHKTLIQRGNTGQPRTPSTPQPTIPAYTEGIPGNLKREFSGRKRCYLTMNSAYAPGGGTGTKR